MDAEQPIIDENLIAELRNYAPTLHDEMFEEMHFIAAWRRDAARVNAINNDGYQPLALLIYEFIGVDWNAAMAEIRRTVEKLKTGDPNSALGLTSRLCELRHSRLEKLGVILEWLRRAINDGDLIARGGQPPYAPLVNRRRFCLDLWLDSKKGETGPLWDKFPDGRVVVKITEVAAWLNKSGVDVPERYKALCAGTQAETTLAAESEPLAETASLSERKETQLAALIEVIKMNNLDPLRMPKKLPNGKHPKGVIVEYAHHDKKAMELMSPPFSASTADNTWRLALKHKRIGFKK